MKVWIDAAAEPIGLIVFGMGLVERHLRSVVRAAAGASMIGDSATGESATGESATGGDSTTVVSEVVISLGPSAGPPALFSGLSDRLPIVTVVEEGTASQRLMRLLRRSAEPVIALSGKDIVDPRLVDWMMGRPSSLVARGTGEHADAVALRLEPGAASWFPEREGSLAAAAARAYAEGRLAPVVADEFPSFVPMLRRDLPYYLLRIVDEHSRDQCERFLFWSNYKGSTDVLTGYVFPPLVWWAVRPLAHWRVHPNLVTALSVLLAFGVIPLFAAGEWAIALALAYLMAVLDSVDGKLARLTYTDSKLGVIIDHGLDIIHPPLWYFAWAVGLGGGRLTDAAVLLCVLYVLDRIVLGIYKQRFKRGLHTRAPIDKAVRNVIARRNTNLLIFTVGLALGAGPTAFYAVVVWQGLTLAYHAARTLWSLLESRLLPARG